jgi:hypothetical protein
MRKDLASSRENPTGSGDGIVRPERPDPLAGAEPCQPARAEKVARKPSARHTSRHSRTLRSTYRRSDARIVENGFATSGDVSKYAKVVLVPLPLRTTWARMIS